MLRIALCKSLKKEILQDRQCLDIWPTSHIWMKALIWIIWAFFFFCQLFCQPCAPLSSTWHSEHCCFITELCRVRRRSQDCPEKYVFSHINRQEVSFKFVLCRNSKRKRKWWVFLYRLKDIIFCPVALFYEMSSKSAHLVDIVCQ